MSDRIGIFFVTAVVVGVHGYALGCDPSGDGMSSDSGTGPDADASADLDTDTDADGDGDADTDSDMHSDSGVDGDTDTDTQERCEDGWYDSDSGLCWQEVAEEERFSLEESIEYCEKLTIGESDNWRLPLIHELITLIRDCPSEECGLSDPDCLSHACSSQPECLTICSEYGGPGDGGCYFSSGLFGSCEYATWSSSRLDDGTGDSQAAWRIAFNTALAMPFDSIDSGSVRCVLDD